MMPPEPADFLDLAPPRRATSAEVLAALDSAEPGLTSGLTPSGSALTPPPAPSTHVRWRHQRVAQLLAKGLPATKISEITGYSPSWISTLQSRDPTFQTLVAHYRDQTEIAFSDAIERMRDLNISATEELQHRIDNDPAAWTKQELMQLMAETSKGIGHQRGDSGVVATPGPVTVNLNFVKPADTPPQDLRPIIDLETTND